MIVAHFYDVESGRKDLDKRGYSTAHERFDIRIPRDGGIQDLLSEARRPDRRFDAVICESIDRVARRTYYGTKVEHDLEADGVALFAADEPISLTGRKATTILTRRVKQGVAEWYVLETLEKSWDGFCEHTRQGWNVGRPPYGYRGDKIPHPVPAKRAEGKVKTKLAPDPITGPIVTAIFTWRVTEQLGYQAIVDRLNADPDRYPSPISPDPARVRTDWTRSSVQDLLRNPKYTGYMVWNRRATKKRGQHNPPEQWVWSPEPTHEPLVTRDVFQAAQQVANRKGSRSNNDPNRHPATRRVYLLRSYVFCAACGRRMFGKTMRNRTTYYACQPTRNVGQAAEDRHPAHVNTVWVREDALLSGLQDLLNRRIFGPDRRNLLAATLAASNHDERRQHQAHRDALQKAIEQIAARQDRLITTLESQDDPDGVLFARVRDRLTDLERDRTTKIAELRSLDTATVVTEDVGLLDQLPQTQVELSQLPVGIQRELFDALQLQIRYDSRTGTALGHIKLTNASSSIVEAAVSPNFGGDHAADVRTNGSTIAGSKARDRPQQTAALGKTPPARRLSQLAVSDRWAV
jgi:DNA invertase Pin-like site-specific DNA recombinase